MGPAAPAATAVEADAPDGAGDLMELEPLAEDPADDDFPDVPVVAPPDAPVQMPFQVPHQVEEDFDIPRIPQPVAPLPEAFPEEGGVPREDQENEPPATYRLIENGSQRKTDLLISSDGFTYGYVSIFVFIVIDIEYFKTI